MARHVCEKHHSTCCILSHAPVETRMCLWLSTIYSSHVFVFLPALFFRFFFFFYSVLRIRSTLFLVTSEFIEKLDFWSKTNQIKLHSSSDTQPGTYFKANFIESAIIIFAVWAFTTTAFKLTISPVDICFDFMLHIDIIFLLKIYKETTSR